MQPATDPVSARPTPVLAAHNVSTSAVSWPAIAAGTVVAAAVSLLLVALGAGAGLGSLSPWPHAGASITSFTLMSAIGLIVVQWLSAGLGGYISGRLRTKWASLHTHEVFFRDTAHGLITWAMATLLVSVAAAVIAGSTIGAGTHAMSSLGAAATPGASNVATSNAGVDPYEVDSLLRPASVDSQSISNDVRAQSTHILTQALATGDVPASDLAYLTEVVSIEARVSPAEARTRVDAVLAKLKTAHEQALRATDSARKAGESASIFTALAMLIGAFIACIAAALGGHRRDVHD
jgi:hypothetical protein